jgi:hypothetical protein
MSRLLKKTVRKDCGHDAAVIDFGDVVMVACNCGSVTNSHEGWSRHDPYTVYETDTCEPPPLPEPKIFDPTPSVSYDGGKTWARVDAHSLVDPNAELDIEDPDAVFFVTCIEDEGEHRRLMLLGPYDTHAEALGNVDRGRKLAEQDPKAHWYYFGTCSMAKDTEVKGAFGK